MKKNNLIQVEISGLKSVDGQEIETVSTFFTTSFYPMYSTKNKVVQKISSYLDGTSESLIDQLILKYSYEANLLSPCDKESAIWKYYTSDWVTFNVCLDLLYNSKLHVGDSDGKVYKRLGDFALSRDSSSINKNDPTKEIIEKLQCEIIKLEPAVKGCTEPLYSCRDTRVDKPVESAPQVIIKGINDPERPMFGRRFLPDARGVQLNGWYYNVRRKYKTDSRYPSLPYRDD